jgi:hypothetical protein
LYACAKRAKFWLYREKTDDTDSHRRQLPKPGWLTEPEKIWAAWRLSGDALIKGQQKSARDWIEFQQNAGIDIVTDGEQFRKHFVQRIGACRLNAFLPGDGSGNKANDDRKKTLGNEWCQYEDLSGAEQQPH